LLAQLLIAAKEIIESVVTGIAVIVLIVVIIFGC
jgi:hypothetical protein